MAENKVVGIVEAHKANKDRGAPITFAEKLAMETVNNPKASEIERKMSVKYLLDLDLARKKQRFAAVNERRHKKHEAKAAKETIATESVITPELAKRLASLKGE